MYLFEEKCGNPHQFSDFRTSNFSGKISLPFLFNLPLLCYTEAMKKAVFIEAVFVLLLALVMVLLLWKKELKDVPLSEVDAAFTAEYDLTGMEKGGAMRLKRAFSLNADDYEEVLYYTPDNTMSVNEFLVIKLKEESQADAVLAGLNSRLETQKKSFDGYGTDQTELLNHAVIYTEGRYLCFFVGREADRWLETVKKVWEG